MTGVSWSFFYETNLKVGETLYNYYLLFKSFDEPKYAKYTLSAILVNAFDDLEDSGKEISPELIEEFLGKELKRFSLPSEKKKFY